MLRAEAPADFVPVLAKEWDRSVRRIWGYVARVRKRLAERSKGLDPEADRELIRALLLEAYRTARGGRDPKGMAQAARTLGEVAQVIGTRKVEITGKDGGPIALSDARGSLAAALASEASEPDSDGSCEGTGETP